MDFARREYDAFGIALRQVVAICLGIFGGAEIERYYPEAGFWLVRGAIVVAIASIFLALSRARQSAIAS